jgi:hypothetical protein
MKEWISKLNFRDWLTPIIKAEITKLSHITYDDYRERNMMCSPFVKCHTGRFLACVNKPLATCVAPLKNRKGQAIIELTLMMPLLAVMLLSLVVICEWGSKKVEALGDIRHEMRLSMNENAAGRFKKNMKQKNIYVDIPGKLKWYFGTPFIFQTLKIEFYEGSYHGKKKNKYHRFGTSLRQINL